MNEITEETLIWAYKPFDVVTNKSGDVGIIQEVSVNSGQQHKEAQISYAVNWLVGDENKHAWFRHSELECHTNLFVEIAKMSCHPFSGSAYSVQSFFNHMRREQ